MPNDVRVWLTVQSENSPNKTDEVLELIKPDPRDDGAPDPMACLGRTSSRLIDFNKIIPVDGLDPLVPDTIYPEPLNPVIERWGTKWNAYDDMEQPGEGICFHTAWSLPVQLLAKLSTMVEAPVLVKWSDQGSDMMCEATWVKGRCMERHEYLDTTARGRELCAELQVKIYEDEED